MKQIAVVVAALLLQLGALSARGIAQELSPDLMQRLGELSRKPISSWTDRELQTLPDLAVAISRDLLLKNMSSAERAAVLPIAIRVVDEDGTAPARVVDGKIMIRKEAVSAAIVLGTYLGHDLYVSSGEELDLPRPLLTRPFAMNEILPLVEPLGQITELPYLGLLQCPPNNTACLASQSAAQLMGTLGFLLAHEMSHVLLRHVESADRSDAQEIAADRGAFSLIHRMAPNLREERSKLSRSVRLAFEAGPLLLLRWQAAGPFEGQLEKRQEALKKQIDEDLLSDAEILAEPEEAVDKPKELRIEWSETPEAIYINGVKIQPETVRGRAISVFGEQRLFAMKEGRFAFARVAARTLGTASVRLSFGSPQGSPPTPSQIREMRRKRDWFSLFLATGRADLRPISAEFARPFFEALHEMSVGRLIGGDLPPGVSDRDRRIIQFWAAASGPLAAWK